MANSESSNAMFFPHIEIADAALLKGALCVWDNIYRIVPEGYIPHDSDDVIQAVESGRLREIRLTAGDLSEARRDYTAFLQSLPFLPDALDRTADGEILQVHSSRMDQLMIAELTDLVGAIRRHGDWLDLPRGVADGYMLYLSNAVAKRRGLSKFTDSDSLFVGMQYFAYDGNFDERIPPLEDEDAAAALILKSFVPDGLEKADMETVLKFCEANRDGREAFRAAMTDLAIGMTKIDDPRYLAEVIDQSRERLEESSRITVARIQEHFGQFQPLLIYLGLPLAARVIDSITGQHDSIGQIAAVGVASITALADIAKSGRKEWVSEEATYYCKLNRKFGPTSPIPYSMRYLDRMMEEFIND
jgi:hypothetical protein